jgi:iron complex transport system permease protein
MDVTTSTEAKLNWPQLRLRRMVLVGLVLLLVGCFLLSLTLGSVKIPLPDIVAILMGGEGARETWTTIVWKFRLPKAITAVLAGAALSVSGLQMQTLFRNPLAGPSVLGVNAGAGLGVAVVVLLTGITGSTLLAGLGVSGDFGIVVAASLGAGLVLALVLAFARRVETMTLLILGLLFSYGVSALVSILLYFAIPERIQAYISWTFGSFGGVTWSQLRLMLPAVLIGLLIAGLLAKSLNALLLGENYAQTLGLKVLRVRWWVVLSTAVLSATITVFCGPIIFLDVAVPHLCRALFNTSDHRILIPTCILLGAIIALIADLIAQLPGSQLTLPLNAVMALFGVPVVMWVILQRNRVVM